LQGRRFATTEQVAQAPAIADIENPVQPRAAHIAVDQQDALVDQRKRDRQVARDGRFSFSRQRARNDKRLNWCVVRRRCYQRRNQRAERLGEGSELALPRHQLRRVAGVAIGQQPAWSFRKRTSGGNRSKLGKEELEFHIAWRAKPGARAIYERY